MEKKYPRAPIRHKILAVTKKTALGLKCDAVENCDYTQPADKFSTSNFNRHIKTIHPVVYKVLCLGKSSGGDGEARKSKPRARPGQTVGESAVARFNRSGLIAGLVKLVAYHKLPFQCVSWEGIQDLVRPQLEAFKMTMDADTVREYVALSSEQIQAMIRDELDGRMIALQVSGTTGRNRQCVACVKCTYVKSCEVIKRILGMIELRPGKTSTDLEQRVEKIKAKFGIHQWQIYTISVDYGSISLDDSQRGTRQTGQEFDDSNYREIFEKYGAALGDKVTVLQCGRHLLSTLATKATTNHQDTVEQIIETVKNFYNEEYESFFLTWQGSYPPLPDRQNHGFETYFMMKALKDERSFFEHLTTQFPALPLHLHWDFIEEFVSAFEPLYDCADRIEHCSLSEFHLHWLLAYGKINSLETNRFRSILVEAMRRQQRILEKCNVYRAALYMDPRLNFGGSKLFNGVTKETIIEYLVSLYDTLEQSPEEKESKLPRATPSSSKPKERFSMNAYLTEMLGEGSSEGSIEQSIREIQNQERWDADDKQFDIMNYWLQKKLQDRRLWVLATTIFAVTAAHCTSSEDFSQLSEQSQDSSLDEEDLKNMFYVQNNCNLLQQAVRELFCEDKSSPAPVEDVDMKID